MGLTHHMPKTPLRGDVYLVGLDPTVGFEIQKTRPALILQNDDANDLGRLTIVAPITSKTDNRNGPSEVLVSAAEVGGPKDGCILVNQIRAIDKRRLVAWQGRVTLNTMDRVEQALLDALGLSERLALCSCSLVENGEAVDS